MNAPAQQPGDGENTAAESTRQPIRTLRQLDTFIDQQIHEAMERGLFDNLPTHGKPLDLDLKDAFDQDAWFVNRTLKNLGAVPEWIELGKEIDAAEARLRWMAEDFARWLDDVRATLRRLTPHEREQRRPGILLRFEDRLARYVRLAEELRAMIDRFNLRVPVQTLEKPGVWVAYERQRLLEPFEAFLREQGWEREPDLAPPPAAPESPPEPARRRRLQLWRMLRGSNRSLP